MDQDEKKINEDIEPSVSEGKSFDFIKLVKSLVKNKLITITAAAVGAIAITAGIIIAVTVGNNGASSGNSGGNSGGSQGEINGGAGDSIICTHQFGDWITENDPTCTEAGQKYRVCAICTEKESEDIAPNGHTAVTDAAVEPTCQQTGLTEGSHCSECDTVLIEQNEIPTIAHTYDDDKDESCNVCPFVRDLSCKHENTTVLKGYDSTCKNSGLTDGKKCTDCQEIILLQQVIAKKPHTEVLDEAIPAKCEETGLTAGSHCSVCNTVLVTPQVTPALNHCYDGKECIRCDAVLEAGLYDENDNLVATWDELKNTYGISFKRYDYYTYRSDSRSPYNVFKNTPELASGVKIVIPDSYDRIYDYLFTETHLKTAVLPDGIIFIGDWAFYGCKNFESVVIPDSVYSIESYAFSGTAISEIDLKKVEYLYTGVFRDCTNLSLVDLGDYLCEIPEQTFYGCSALSEIQIPSNVYSIQNSAFTYTSLSTITLPDSVYILDDYAFDCCYELVEMNIGAGISDISPDMFLYCEDIENINVSENNGNYCSVDGVVYSKDLTKIVYFPCARSENYYTILDGVTEIGSYAFRNASNLSATVYLPETLEVICANAFHNAAVSFMTLPASVREIQGNAFYDCVSLHFDVDYRNEYYCSVDHSLYNAEQTVLIFASYPYSPLPYTIPDGIITIAPGALSGINFQSTLYIPASVVNMQENELADFAYLRSIEVDEANECFKTIDGNLYSKDGTKLLRYVPKKTDTQFAVPDGVTEICGGAFMHASELSSLVISEDVTKIGESAWEYLINTIYYMGSEEQWNQIEIHETNFSHSIDIIFNYAP